MTRESFNEYRAPRYVIRRGLSFNILELLKEKRSLTIDEAIINIPLTSWYRIRDTLSSLLKKNFVFRIDETYYFSPNAVLITTQRLSKIPLIQEGN